MIKTKPLLSAAKLQAVSEAMIDVAKKESPQGSGVLEALKPKPDPKSSQILERAGQWFRLLRASAAEKSNLAAIFFKTLRNDLGTVLLRLKMEPKQFGFASLDQMVEFLKAKLTKSRTRAKSIKGFLDGMEGRKWQFIGSVLFERYIKYGPVRRFLDETVRDALGEINRLIKTSSIYKMANAKGEAVLITDEFGPPKVGVEFLDGNGKQFLDFGHVSLNKQGYWLLPTPTEIKQLEAAEGVDKQFGNFLRRIREAINGKKNIYVRYEGADEFVPLDPNKLVFDPLAKNQIVVKPAREAWGSVGKPEKNPDIDIGVGVSGKQDFFYWVFEVEVSRNSFEETFKAIFRYR